MRDRLATFVATGFGVGRLPVAPGTAGSVLGVAYWWLLRQSGNWWLYGLVVLAGLMVAVVCAGRAAIVMNKPDPAVVVIDELAAVPVALAGIGTVWWQLALGFALFRLFDISKPPPVRQAQALPGGWGIVVDDVLAAVYACAGTHAAIWFTNWLQR